MSKKPLDLLIAFDPGGTTGGAVFVHQRLVKCGYWDADKIPFPLWNYAAGGVVQIEFPIAYPGARSKEDPNDLLRNAWRGGYIARGYRDAGFTIEEVFPVKWKGTVPKDVVQERVLEGLQESEKALMYSTISSRSRLKKLDHNMVDAVGQGLWRLDRY